jgi:hypothetical protein
VLAADSIRSSEIRDTNVKKPILVVASLFSKEIEDRIDRDYDPRRNPNTVPFSREQLSAAADGTDAIFVVPLDRLSKSIGLLPRGAVVVNRARGGLVVDEGLIAALRADKWLPPDWTYSMDNRKSIQAILR